MESQIEKLRQLVAESDNIVFFGGAGVSTESGIPDFRSVDGLYNEQWDYPPETILGHSFFTKHPDIFYRYYREKLIIKDAKPNKAHLKLAELESEGKLRAVITQNVDGLHQAAGSKNVLELHGSTRRNYCVKCKHEYEASYIAECEDVPRCKYCGGIVRPDIVLYEEQLDAYVMKRAMEYISNADVFIIGGTSLAVYPAAGMIDYYSGNKLVLINKSTTPYDSRANLIISGSIGEMFSQI